MGNIRRVCDMKKILYHLQLSNVDVNKQFNMSKDSNFSFFCNLSAALEEYFPGKYQFHLLVPSEMFVSKEDIRILSKMGNKTLILHRSDYSRNVFSSRYHWDDYEMNYKIKLIEPDIIWENNPTLVNNWKTLLLEMNLIDKIKVVTYNHWIDTEEYPKIDRRAPYTIRQAEGYLLSDLYLCNSKEACQQVEDGVIMWFSNWKTPYTFTKLHNIPPIISEKEIADSKIYEKDEQIVDDDVVRIVYNHRLSSLPYYKSAYDFFMKNFSSMLRDKRFKTKLKNVKCEIIFTDVSSKTCLDKLQKDLKIPKEFKNITIRHESGLSRNSYLKLLRSTDICVGTFVEKFGGCWSMSLAEGILTENAVLIPQHSGYLEMVYSEHYLGMFSNAEDFKSKLYALMVSQKYRSLFASQAYKHYMSKNSAKKVVTKLDKLLNNILN